MMNAWFLDDQKSTHFVLCYWLGGTKINWKRCTWETGPVDFTPQTTGWDKISECETTR